MPQLKDHSLIHSADKTFVVNDKTREIIGEVNEILNSPDCEEICKQFVHENCKEIRSEPNFDPDWNRNMRQYGYVHYVDDKTQSLFARGFYLFDNTATESFKSFLKVINKRK